MKKIGRHVADEVNFGKIEHIFKKFDTRESLLSKVSNLLENIENWDLKSISNSFLSGFYNANYLSEVEWAKKFWFYANELNRLIFDLNLHPGEEVEIVYNGNKVTLVGFHKPGMPLIYDCWEYLKYAQQAICSRDKKQIQNLLQIDTETMFRKIAEYGSLIPDNIDPITHDFYLQLLAGNESQAAATLRTIIEEISTKPRSCVKNYAFMAEKRDNVDLLLLPYYKCLESVLKGEQLLFDELLWEGLQKHKEWAMVKLRSPKNYLASPNSNADISFVSVPLSAVCSIAYDKGMAINVESDYIPEWLYKNEGYDLNN
jgi:hypothetical protein